MRILREESGFSLPEMLVTMTMMVVVLFALYSIFDMGLRVYSFGNDKVEAVENARLGLEKMEREIRAAYPLYRDDSTRNYLFFSAGNATLTNSTTTTAPPKAMPTTSRITFGNDLDGNGKVTCLSSTTCEYITYKLSGNALVRNNTATGSTSTSGDQPVVEYVQASGLTFTYFKKNATTGDLVALTSTELTDSNNEKNIVTVRVSLNIRVQRGPQAGTQTLTTDVDLRNRE